jgi:putative nucleotidyltransferase with HDIG domain
MIERWGAKLGKGFFPVVFGVFLLLFVGILYSNVMQKNVDYKEGQVAEENIRANKTVENEAETKQKQKLAQEAVTPEYTYQSDLKTTQHDWIKSLFTMIADSNDTVDKDYKADVAKAKDGASVGQPTTDDRVAAVKKAFEKVEADELAFFQSFPNYFYQIAVQLSDSELAEVSEQGLKLTDEQMSGRIRTTDLEAKRNLALDKIQYLDVNEQQQQLIKYVLDLGIVVNDFLNAKKTTLLQKQAKEAVQPVMIYQGEVIVREGNQIDAAAMSKLKLLGMTSSDSTWYLMVALIGAGLLQIAVLYYLARQYSRVQNGLNFTVFYIALMVFSLCAMKFFQYFQSDSAPYSALLYPAAFTPIMLTIFTNRRSGIIAALFQAVFAIFIYYDAIGTNLLAVILISYVFSGLAATLVARKRILDQGKQSFFWLMVFPFMLDIVLVIYQGMSFTESKTWLMLACGLVGCLLSFLLAVGMYPYAELLVTDNSMIALNELSNPNHPLLKQLLEEAPGTYHHSLMVANLSANAVAEIGGRSLLTRVACYYHDIGKIKHANFFVENLPQGAENPHNFLLPEDSKQIIFGHVLDGEKMLTEAKMPQMVIDICRQHHGTTLMQYFYVKAKERDPNVTEADYRYPGPKPQTREAGIISIADSCEAAVRAMDHPTNEKIRQFVHDLIDSRIRAGELDESGLTLGELRKVEKSLVGGLSSTFHSRIKYPKMKSEAEEMKSAQEGSEN